MSDRRRILILSFYYPPDLSAGSFRTAALVQSLLHEAGDRLELHVVTTEPNRYHTYSAPAAQSSNSDSVRIDRVRLPGHRSGMVDQALTMRVFWREALRLTGNRDYDLIFASSSRLLTATLGARIARAKGVPLYLDIRDLFADTIQEVLPRFFGWAAGLVVRQLEHWTMSRAAHVNLVSRGFEEYFRERYPSIPLSFVPNGIDNEFLSVGSSTAATGQSINGRLQILYAGNIGEGQGLHIVVPDLALRLADRADFTIVGDGGRRRHLERAVHERRLTNVRILDPMSRPALIQQYQAADVLFLHLNDYQAFKKVLPSKVFEYGALGKPIWAGVAGYAAAFLREEVSNAAVFPPCDVERGVLALDALALGTSPRTNFLARYSRRTLMSILAQDVLRLAGVVP